MTVDCRDATVRLLRQTFTYRTEGLCLFGVRVWATEAAKALKLPLVSQVKHYMLTCNRSQLCCYFPAVLRHITPKLLVGIRDAETQSSAGHRSMCTLDKHSFSDSFSVLPYTPWTISITALLKLRPYGAIQICLLSLLLLHSAHIKSIIKRLLDRLI